MALDQAGCFSQTPGFCFHSINVTTGRLATPSSSSSFVCFLHLLPLAEVDGGVKCYALAVFKVRDTKKPPQSWTHVNKAVKRQFMH